MKELFIPFSIPNLESIQQELLAAIDHDYRDSIKPYAFTYQEEYMKQTCPLFMSWLLPRLKLPVRLYRYYVTPPGSKLAIHIDGTNPTVPFALNIPVAGTRNTLHTFYETPKENMTFKTGPGYLGATQPIDYNRLVKVADLEIVTPHVTNNSVFHGVTNNTDQHRVMFTVRWTIDHVIGRNVHECMEFSDLFVTPS